MIIATDYLGYITCLINENPKGSTPSVENALLYLEEGRQCAMLRPIPE